jgi:hypothetical protein
VPCPYGCIGTVKQQPERIEVENLARGQCMNASAKSRSLAPLGMTEKVLFPQSVKPCTDRN